MENMTTNNEIGFKGVKIGKKFMKAADTDKSKLPKIEKIQKLLRERKLRNICTN